MPRERSTSEQFKHQTGVSQAALADTVAANCCTCSSEGGGHVVPGGGVHASAGMGLRCTPSRLAANHIMSILLGKKGDSS